MMTWSVSDGCSSVSLPDVSLGSLVILVLVHSGRTDCWAGNAECCTVCVCVGGGAMAYLYDAEWLQ